MSEPFAAKLSFILKAFSMSRGRLAADMGVDKSVVGRWVTGAVVPSEHNLMLMTAQFARRAPGFTSLSWERSLAELAELIGVDHGAAPTVLPIPVNRGLPLAILDQIRATTALRGAAYQEFFRSTRPFVLQPGRLLHDPPGRDRPAQPADGDWRPHGRRVDAAGSQPSLLYRG